MLGLGTPVYLLHLAKSTSADAEVETVTKATNITEVDAAVDNIVAMLDDDQGPEAADYAVVHAAPGGVRLLLGAGLTFLASPERRHLLAVRVRGWEERIHGATARAWHPCLRTKAGSNKCSEALLDSMDPTGI